MFIPTYQVKDAWFVNIEYYDLIFSSKRKKIKRRVIQSTEETFYRRLSTMLKYQDRYEEKHE